MQDILIAPEVQAAVVATGFTYDPNVRLLRPRNTLVHSSGNLWIADTNGIKVMTQTGSVSKIVAITGVYDLAELPSGNVIAAIQGANVIREYDQTGAIVADRYGDGTGANLSGAGTAAQIDRPSSLWISGNTLYSASFLAFHTIDITTWAGVSSAVAFNLWGYDLIETGGSLYGTVYNRHTVKRDGAHWAGVFNTAGQPPTNLQNPRGITTDGTTIWITHFNAVVEVNLTTAALTLLAGDATAGAVDGIGTAARFRGASIAWGIRHDAANNRLIIADENAHAIRALDLTTNEVTTIAGALDQMGDVDS